MDQKRLAYLVLALVVLAGAACRKPFPVPQWQYASAHSNPQAALEAVRQIYIAEFPQLDDPDLVPVEAAWANLKLGGQAKEQRCSYLIKFRIVGDYIDGMAFIDQRHPDPHGFGYLEFKHPTASQHLNSLLPAGKGPYVSVLVFSGRGGVYYPENFDPPEIVYDRVFDGILPPILQP